MNPLHFIAGVLIGIIDAGLPARGVQSQIGNRKSQMRMIPWGAPKTVLKDKAGLIISCWKMSWLERLRVFFSGRIYIASQTQSVRPLTTDPMV